MIFVIAIGAYFYPTGTTTIVQPNDNGGLAGSVTGPDVYSRMFLHAGSTAGGRLATTSTATAYKPTTKDFAGLPTVISWTPNVNTTLTLVSSSTWGYVPNVGDVANIYIRNASTTAAATITFAANDQFVDLQFTEATGGDLVLNGLDWEKVTLIRTTAATTTIILNEMTEAD